MAEATFEVRIFLFGGFRIENSSGEDVTPTSKKSRALIAYLALSEYGSASREKLAAIAWSTRGEKQARDSLRQTLSSLRRNQKENNHSWLDLGNGESVSIDLEKVWVDVHEVRKLVASDLDEDCARVMDLCRGELLDMLYINDPGFEHWIAEERERLRSEVELRLVGVLRGKTEAGDLEFAAKTAQFLLTLDSSNEEVHRQLIRIHSSRGDNAAAVRQFQTLKEILREELDVEPSSESIRLFEAIKRGTPAGDNGAAEQSSQREVVPVRTHSPVAVLESAETRVAVLPLETCVRDASTELPADYLGQTLVNALSRFRWLSVLGQFAARNLLREHADVLDLSRTLKIEYMVDGSIICTGQGLRIAVELIHCASAHTVWADNVPCDVADDLLSLEEIASVIASAIENQIRLHQADLARRRSLQELTPQMMVMRATPLIYKMTGRSVEEAGTLMDTAVDLEPTSSNAFAWNAFLELIKVGQGWVDDRPSAIERLNWLTRTAIHLDPDNSMARALRGHVESFVYHDFEQAHACFDRALKVNRNDPVAWAFSAVTHSYLGNTTEAIQRLNRYSILSPTDPHSFYFETAYCLAYAFSGDYAAAIQAGKTAIGGNPHYYAAYRPLISSLGNVGRVEEARSYLDVLLANEPHFSIDWMKTVYPPIQGDQIDRYFAGLKKAGVPLN